MKRVYHIIASGLAGIGLADGLAAVYRTNSPVKLPRIQTAQEARSADAAAIHGDFARVYAEVCRAYAKA